MNGFEESFLSYWDDIEQEKREAQERSFREHIIEICEKKHDDHIRMILDPLVQEQIKIALNKIFDERMKDLLTKHLMSISVLASFDDDAQSIRVSLKSQSFELTRKHRV